MNNELENIRKIAIDRLAKVSCYDLSGNTSVPKLNKPMANVGWAQALLTIYKAEAPITRVQCQKNLGLKTTSNSSQYAMLVNAGFTAKTSKGYVMTELGEQFVKNWAKTIDICLDNVHPVVVPVPALIMSMWFDSGEYNDNGRPKYDKFDFNADLLSIDEVKRLLVANNSYNKLMSIKASNVKNPEAMIDMKHLKDTLNRGIGIANKINATQLSAIMAKCA